ncbi:MAG TPA: right-handed parallel beta-helix repeat-containing protein [bacterium]|nr:right-handed parallel beta-helix repeat-containing protein [bacterium]HPP00559.1 right-handed parallel beta-helix repeat-containing protein [bacterium]
MKLTSFLLIFLLGGHSIHGAAAGNRQGILPVDERWSLADSPMLIEDHLLIPEGVTVIVEPGVEIRVNPRAVITVQGRFIAVGSSRQPVRIHAHQSGRWGAVSYESRGSGWLEHCVLDRGSYGAGDRIGVVNAYQCVAPVVIDSCTFTNWPEEFNAKAVQGFHSTSLVVRNCYFGPGANEAVHGVNCPALVEFNTFDRRYDYRDAVDIGYTQNPGPVIRYNVFWGSDDDAIDLDRCDAWVEGNWVIDCRRGNNDPIGISGDNLSRPVIVNNVIIGCESGIGFKNGADITVINNTIIGCGRGIWLHQNPTHATVINTLIWGGEDQESIRLEPGSTIDVRYSLIQGDPVYPGEGNLNGDPRFADPLAGDYRLSADSPAIDAGWGGPEIPEVDYLRQPRFDAPGVANTGKGTPNWVDIGAFEFQPAPSAVPDWLTQ